MQDQMLNIGIALIALLLLQLGTAGYTSASNVSLRGNIAPDAIYVIGMEQCEERWKRARAWADSYSLEITSIFGTRFDKIDLRQPPIPIANVPAANDVMAGQVACTTSHIRAWRHAFARNYSNIIVLEDDVRMTESLVHRIPQILFDAKQGSRLRSGLPWHFIFLRMHPTVFERWNRREAWHGRIHVANPGWGTAAYVASGAGIRYFLTRITAFSRPLDVQIERFQRDLDTQGAKFVALDVCDVDFRGNAKPGCPENIHELSLSERGNCYFSASQSGQSIKGLQFPGAVKG